MIQHVVVFRFRGGALDERREHARVAADHLNAMRGHIPGMSQLTVSFDLSGDPGHWEMSLVSQHDSRAALADYIAHPLHLAAKSIIDDIVETRAIVDSEINGKAAQ